MTDITAQDIFKDMNLGKILVAALEVQKELTIPAVAFLSAANEDKEIKVEYNPDTQEFIFNLVEKNEQRDDNNSIDESVSE